MDCCIVCTSAYLLLILAGADVSIRIERCCKEGSCASTGLPECNSADDYVVVVNHEQARMLYINCSYDESSRL